MKLPPIHEKAEKDYKLLEDRIDENPKDEVGQFYFKAHKAMVKDETEQPDDPIVTETEVVNRDYSPAK